MLWVKQHIGYFRAPLKSMCSQRTVLGTEQFGKYQVEDASYKVFFMSTRYSSHPDTVGCSAK